MILVFLFLFNLLAIYNCLEYVILKDSLAATGKSISGQSQQLVKNY